MSDVRNKDSNKQSEGVIDALLEYLEFLLKKGQKP